jgi:hypothetical protein
MKELDRHGFGRPLDDDLGKLIETALATVLDSSLMRSSVGARRFLTGLSFELILTPLWWSRRRGRGPVEVSGLNE